MSFMTISLAIHCLHPQQKTKLKHDFVSSFNRRRIERKNFNKDIINFRPCNFQPPNQETSSCLDLNNTSFIKLHPQDSACLI